MTRKNSKGFWTGIRNRFKVFQELRSGLPRADHLSLVGTEGAGGKVKAKNVKKKAGFSRRSGSEETVWFIATGAGWTKTVAIRQRGRAGGGGLDKESDAHFEKKTKVQEFPGGNTIQSEIKKKQNRPQEPERALQCSIGNANQKDRPKKEEGEAWGKPSTTWSKGPVSGKTRNRKKLHLNRHTRIRSQPNRSAHRKPLQGPGRKHRISLKKT